MSRFANSGLKAVWDGVPPQVRSVVLPGVGSPTAHREAETAKAHRG